VYDCSMLFSQTQHVLISNITVHHSHMLVFNQETYPNFPVPYKTTITRLVGHFYESGSVDDIPGLCDF
jgi:hypothetical protein